MKNQVEIDGLIEVARLARKESDLLAPPGVATNLIDVRGAVALRNLAEKIETLVEKIKLSS